MSERKRSDSISAAGTPFRILWSACSGRFRDDPAERGAVALLAAQEHAPVELMTGDAGAFEDVAAEFGIADRDAGAADEVAPRRTAPAVTKRARRSIGEVRQPRRPGTDAPGSRSFALHRVGSVAAGELPKPGKLRAADLRRRYSPSRGRSRSARCRRRDGELRPRAPDCVPPAAARRGSPESCRRACRRARAGRSARARCPVAARLARPPLAVRPRRRRRIASETKRRRGCEEPGHPKPR